MIKQFENLGQVKIILGLVLSCFCRESLLSATEMESYPKESSLLKISKKLQKVEKKFLGFSPLNLD